jgi:aspartate carbamoyltransferase regulatory subunit
VLKAYCKIINNDVPRSTPGKLSWEALSTKIEKSTDDFNVIRYKSISVPEDVYKRLCCLKSDCVATKSNVFI